MKWWPRITLMVSLLFIVTATLTPGSASQADALPLSFWCFACGPLGGADFTANIVLFIPLGIALSLVGVRPTRAVLLGALLSGAVELAQGLGYPPHRVANITDFGTNTLGTLLGVLAGVHRQMLLLPTRTQARNLGVASLLLVSALLSFCAWALGLPKPLLAVVPATSEVRRSELSYTPGYGWYHGLVHDATVNGVVFTHRGDGPVLLQADPQSTYHVSMRLSGRDEREGFVPFLYVHGAAVLAPVVMLGQRGSAAELRVPLRGAALRLPAPVLVLPDAFATRVDAPRTLAASVSSSVWTLTSRAGPAEERSTEPGAERGTARGTEPSTERGTEPSTARGTEPGAERGTESSTEPGLVRDATLQVSLSLGWTLFQTLVQVGSAPGVVMSLVWLFVLWFPAGYWCTTATSAAFVTGDTPKRTLPSTRRWWGALLACGVLILVLTVAPAVADISRSSVQDFVSAFGGMAAGVLMSGLVTARVVRKRQRSQHNRTAHII